MTDPTMDDASNAALAKTPSSRKTFAASMPVSWQNARTPSRAKTPGAAKTPARFGLAKTPGGKPKTPGISSRFAQAPERVVVDDKPKPKTPGGYHRQLMLPARKTPGKQPMVNPAPSMLSSLPNATHATFWLRKSAREEERTGDLVQALYHLDTGIKRGAEPVAHLQDAKDALRSRMNSSATDATDANETEADTADADVMSGSVVVMETVRTPNRLLDAVDGHKTVVTPVRRSARKTPDADGVSHHSSSVQRAMTHNSIQRTLSANDYAYAPNDALGDVHAHDEEVAAAAESLDEDAKLINAIGNNNDDTSDAFDANAENKEFAQLEAEAAFAAASEEATVAANAAVHATSNGRSFTVNSSGKKSKGVVYTDSRGGSRPSSLSKARSLDAPLRQSPADKTARKMSFSSQSGSDSGNEARTLDANSPAETRSVVAALASVELLTPNSEFAAMEAAAEAAAARARGTGALARSSSIPANYSPMKPPQSPASTKKSTAMARAASLAAAMSRTDDDVDADAELDAAAIVAVPMFEPATFESPASMVSPTALLPNLPTPTLRLPTPTPTLAQEAAMAKTPAPVPVAISTFGPSPGKAAREAAEAAGESPTDAVAEAVARATPYSCVDTSRRDRNRTARTTPSPVSFQTSQEETPGAEFARLEAEAAAEARADVKWAEALAAAERKAAEADEMDDFVFPTRESPGQRDDYDSIEDATVAIPTVGFMPAPAEEDDDACDMEEEAEDRTVAIPTIGFRPVPITPGGYLDRYRHTPAAAAAAATGLTPAFKLLAMQAQSPAIAKMAALSASVVAESVATKSAVKAPRSPVKFTTVPTPRFEQEDDEKVLDAPSPVMEEEEEVVEEPSPMPMDEDVAPMQEDTRSPMPAPVVQDTTRMSSPMSSRAPSSPTIEQIAPNAAALIATPGSAKKTSPLSVFARMMAKVINDTHEELSKSVVKHRARELMEAEGGTAVDDLTAQPSPPKSAARLPSPAARTPTVSTTVTTLNGLSPAAMEEGETTPPATVPSPMGSIKGSPAIRVPSGHPAAGVPEENSEVLNSPTFDNSTGLTPALARMGIQPHVHAATPVTPKDDLVNEDGFETDEATPLGVVIHAGTPMGITPRVTRNSLTKAREQKRASAMKSVDRLHAGVATGRPRTPASVGTGMKGKKPPVSPARGGGGSRSSKKSSMGAAAAAAAAGATPGTHGGLRRSKRLSAGSETPTSAKKQWEN